MVDLGRHRREPNPAGVPADPDRSPGSASTRSPCVCCRASVPRDVTAAVANVTWRAPEVAANAVSGLKFSAALPLGLARHTLAERLGDEAGARAAVDEPRRIHRS